MWVILCSRLHHLSLADASAKFFQSWEAEHVNASLNDVKLNELECNNSKIGLNLRPFNDIEERVYS